MYTASWVFFVCLFVFVQGLNYLELETVKGLFGSISYWKNLLNVSDAFSYIITRGVSAAVVLLAFGFKVM